MLYQLPAISLFAFCIAGVSLGIAQSAIEHFTETTGQPVSVALIKASLVSVGSGPAMDLESR